MAHIGIMAMGGCGVLLSLEDLLIRDISVHT